jgi:hypothetical protein
MYLSEQLSAKDDNHLPLSRALSAGQLLAEDRHLHQKNGFIELLLLKNGARHLSRIAGMWTT